MKDGNQISIALCTYNGSRYLPEQLASLAAQEMRPTELVVCDDGSTDDTVELVQQFATAAPFEVRLQVNEQNLGSTTNFAQAISMCRSSVIALCDQDDVWYPHKLRRLAEAFAAAPSAGFVFSDAEMVDQDLQPLGYRLWEAVRFDAGAKQRVRSGRAYEALLKRYFVTGATMAFKAEYRSLVLPIAKSWIHDGWIALLISAVADCTFVDEPLIQYRQHGRQQIGEKKRNLYAQYLVAKGMTRDTYARAVESHEDVLRRLQCREDIMPHRLESLRHKIAHFSARTKMRDSRSARLPLIAREFLRGRYSRYSLGWKSVAQDLWLA